jgi:hypothetical protein
MMNDQGRSGGSREHRAGGKLTYRRRWKDLTTAPIFKPRRESPATLGVLAALLCCCGLASLAPQAYADGGVPLWTNV